jgi:hypothetical protein
MDEDTNLTKQASPREPARDYPARTDTDGQVHQVRAAPVDLVDPARVRTECGQAVLEIFNDGRDVDCPRCGDGPGQD